MSGIAPADGYAVGFHKGSDDYRNGRVFDDNLCQPHDNRMGYQDGWTWADDKAREAAGDRALLAANSLLPAKGAGR